MELPLEIWDIVIDHLHPDKQSLVACGLTCKAWVSGSQFHLFRRIYLRARNIHGFLDILRSPTNPGSYVRRMELSDIFSDGSMTISWLIEVLPVLVDFLPNIIELDIQCGFLDDLTRGLLASGFPKVEALTIWSMIFDTFIQATGFIASFVALKRLECYDINLTYPDNHQDIPPTCPRGLHTLHWWGVESRSHIFNFLLGQRDIPNIRTLTFALSMNRNVLRAGELLRRLGPNLEHLSISYTGWEINQQTFSSDKINLSYDTRLRSMHLGNLNLWWNLGRLSWGWIPTILSQIASSQIEEIHFDFVINKAEELDVVDWAQIDCIIGRLFTIKEVSLLRTVRKFEDPIRMRLPILETRGVIRVSEE